jgi:hypothetical protein
MLSPLLWKITSPVSGVAISEKSREVLGCPNLYALCVGWPDHITEMNSLGAMVERLPWVQTSHSKCQRKDDQKCPKLPGEERGEKMNQLSAENILPGFRKVSNPVACWSSRRSHNRRVWGTEH